MTAGLWLPALASAEPLGHGTPRPIPQTIPGTPEAISTSVQASALVRSGLTQARHAREMELGRLLAECPEIALLEGESLAVLELKDPSLDSLRHELLNLAASGSSLEKAGVQTHFTRKGMADLLARFAGPAVEDEDPRTLFQRVVVQLRKQAGTRTGRTVPGPGSAA